MEHQATAEAGPVGQPLISVIMANYRGARHLGAAIRAVLAQSHSRIELLLADDASDDDSLQVAASIADDRLRILPSDRTMGPAGTRNRALRAAGGDWIAIVDSDDLIHPRRLERLLAVAVAQGADIVADDLVHFGTVEATGGRTLLQPLGLTAPVSLDVAMFLRGSAGEPGVPSFGYLKPLISRRVLGGNLYDESLKIGEDNELIIRLLVQGARFIMMPDPLYGYRRHAGSVSHRLSVETTAAILAAHRGLPHFADPAARAVAAKVERQLYQALKYEILVRDIKNRHLLRAAPRLLDPAMLVRLLGSVQDRRRRARASTLAAPAAKVPASCPDLPAPGGRWTTPPAQAAALVAAEASAGRDQTLSPLPEWATWLDRAVRES
nr:glycosyltransferase [Paracoccus saliphilus]